MENLSHSRHPNRVPRKACNGNGNVNLGGGKPLYDDVFGGLPKSGVTTLSPRAEDYSEIFGSFNASRASSIPVLDLPEVDEAEVYFDVRSSGFDYSDVFGGSEGSDFAASYEDLFGKSMADCSSDEAWPPAETESYSEESYHSGDDPCFSIENPYQYFEGSTEFNISYHKASRSTKEDLSNGLRHTAQVQAVPGYTFLVDQAGFLPETVTKTEPLDRREAFEINFEPQRGHDSDSKGFVTISEISLHTEPSHLPPPSRPPPSIDIRKGDSCRSTSNCTLTNSDVDNSPPFFDVEVDASSSSAASAAAMKEAMIKAQAKMKSAKELMERKKESLQGHAKPDSTSSIRSAEQKNGRGSFSSQGSDKIDGADEWKEATQFFELVTTEKHKKAMEQTNVDQFLEQHAEVLLRRQTVMEVYEQEEENAMTTKSVWQEYELEEEKLKVPEDAFGLEESNGRSKAARDKLRLREHENKINGAARSGKCENFTNVQHKFEFEQARKNKKNEHNLKEGPEVFDQESTEKRLKEKTRRDEKKKLKEAHERAENEKILIEALQRLEDKKIEEALEQEEKEKEKEKKLKEAREWEEWERRQRKAREREEDEKRLKAVRAREENEKKLKVAREQEETDRRQSKARELEENKKRLKEAREMENMKRLKEAREREENEKKLKAACEQEEIERRRRREAREIEENVRRLKEAREREENEKKLKEAREREEIERRQKEAREIEENVRRLKETREREEHEKRLKEACEREENEKRLKEARVREEHEKRLKEAREREEHEKRLKEAREREENEKRLKEAREREEHEKRLKEAREREEHEKRLKEAREREEHEKRLEEAREREENEKRLIEACEREEQEKRLKEAREREEHEKRLKEAREKQEHEKRLKEAREREENEMRQKEARVKDEKEKRQKEASERKGEENRRKEAHEREENEKKWREALEESVKKQNEARGREDTEKRFKDSYGGNEVEKRVEDFRESTTNSKTSNIDLDGKESEDRERKPVFEHGGEQEADQPVLLERRGNLHKIDKQASRMQGAVRKNKDVDERESERVKRERELEQERLRKIEEEIEREREREKDRMAVDRATLEARENAREKVERAAMERATAEARQRVLAEARERLEKACAEAREKSLPDKAAMEAKLRAERAAVERATAEARERAAFGARERVERSFSDKFSGYGRNVGLRHSSSSSDLQDLHFQSVGSSGGSRNLNSSVSGASCYAERCEGNEGESAQRCRARLERHRRTAERAAKALAEKNMRDLLAQREQTERNRLSETLDAEVKRWSSGKEGNLRALLSTLQYILGSDSGWQPVPLTEVITNAAVKKAYRKATLCVHPDKLQQRGANIQQKYICEKVFDLLKEAWNRFNSEER